MFSRPPMKLPQHPGSGPIQAGPIQTKKVNEALREITRQNQCYTEIHGVHGLPATEHRSSYWQLCGSQQRADVAAALKEIGDAFNWTVTRENYADIVGTAKMKLQGFSQGLCP